MTASTEGGHPRRILVVAFGSRGDVYPMLALARALRQRSHRVLFASNPYFEPLARGMGLEFVGHGSAESFAGRMRGSRLEGRGSRPLRAPPGVSWVAQGMVQWRIRKRVITESMGWTYRLIEQLRNGGETVVVAHSNALGARIAQEKLGVPLATVHLQPAILRSRYDAPGLPLPDGASLPLRGLRRLLWASIDCVADRILTPEVNVFRAELRLSPVHRPFAGWIHSPDLVLGLFPDWFAPPPPDWPPNLHLVGFPLLDESGVCEMPVEMRSFVNTGVPLLVFTVGSFARRSRRFFEVSVEVCSRMGWRGLLLAPSRELVPVALPETVRFFEYAPLRDVLPGAAAIVHHGGIGTTALALAAGVPQLVVPFADDQSDNAARVQRLNAGMVMTRAAYRPRAVARALEKLLASSGIALACRSAAERMRRQDPLSEACRLIETLGSRCCTGRAESAEGR